MVAANEYRPAGWRRGRQAQRAAVKQPPQDVGPVVGKVVFHLSRSYNVVFVVPTPVEALVLVAAAVVAVVVLLLEACQAAAPQPAPITAQVGPSAAGAWKLAPILVKLDSPDDVQASTLVVFVVGRMNMQSAKGHVVAGRAWPGLGPLRTTWPPTGRRPLPVDRRQGHPIS